MSVIPLTLTISLCLVFTFIVFFLKETSRRRFSSVERESLLPLADETPRLAGSSTQQENHTEVSSEQAPCSKAATDIPPSHN